MSIRGRKPCQCEDQQPTRANSDVSDWNPFCLPQAHVGDGVNGSQVALHAGQEVEKHLPTSVDIEHVDAYIYHFRVISVDTRCHKYAAEDTHQLYDNHVVGEEVGMVCHHAGALLLPLLETHVEDEDVDRQEDEDAGDGEGGHDITACRGV